MSFNLGAGVWVPGRQSWRLGTRGLLVAQEGTAAHRSILSGLGLKAAEFSAVI